jgi:hypothetical protein
VGLYCLVLFHKFSHQSLGLPLTCKHTMH